MIISEDTSDAKYQIKAYKPGSVQINDTQHTQSLIVCAHTLITNWPPQTIKELTHDHWDPIIKLKPDILLIGTGQKFINLSHALLAPLYANHLGVECMSTDAACRTYMALLSEGRNVAAALIIDKV